MNASQPRVIVPIFNPSDFITISNSDSLQPQVDTLNATIVTLQNAIKYVGFATQSNLWTTVDLASNGQQTIPNPSLNQLNFGWFGVDSISTGGAYTWSIQGSQVAAVIGNNVQSQYISTNTDFFTGTSNSNFVIYNQTGQGIQLNNQGPVYSSNYLITLL